MRRGESKAKGVKQGGRTRTAGAKARAGRKDASSASLAAQLAAKTREFNEAVAHQAATAEVLRAISRSTFDLQTVLNTLVESAARLCEADRAAINRQTGTISEPLAFWGYSPEYISYRQDHPIPLGRGSIVGRAFVERRSVHIPDLLADPDFEMKEEVKAIGLRTMLAVPLMREGAWIGILNLARHAVRPFTKQQIELAETFADQAVIAIENTRLLNELRESLQQLTATSEVLQVISSSPTNLQPVLDAVVTSAARLCEALDAMILFREGEVLVPRAHSGPLGSAPFGQQQPLNPHW